MSRPTPTNGTPSNGNASLSDVLSTPALRTELATIIALCSDAMRRDLLNVFEPIKRRTKGEQNTTFGDSLVNLEDSDPSVSDLRAEEAQLLDLQSPRTQGLLRAALTYFDRWQIDVLRRLGEILSVQSSAVRKARADAKARAEVVAKSVQDQAYWEWAHGMEVRVNKADDPDETDASTILPEGFKAHIINMPKEKRIIILDSMLLLLLSLEHYSAHSRVLMLKLTRIFRLPESMLIESEAQVAKGLLTSAATKMSADESTQRQAAENASSRRWKVGLATVAGAALIGVTGGLAAPILAAGVGGIMGGLGLGAVASLLGPLATNMVLVGGLFGAYGGNMTGNIMTKYAQDVKDFKFIPVAMDSALDAGMDHLSLGDDSGIDQLRNSERRDAHKLRVAIGISGSVADPNEFVIPWRIFSPSRIETFGLRWELDALQLLGRKMSEVLQSFAWDFAKYQLLSLVLAGLWPFGLLRAASSLDSPFAVAKTRSDKAGRVLADALINKVQGSRPVSLVGYGLGARVIYSCMLQLADLNAFGLVESVVFMGAATPADAASWRRIRAVASGRVVNIFSDNDFMLGFLYRASSVQMGIAGVQPVKGIIGVENYDFADMIKGHDNYKHLVGTILHRIGFTDVDNEVVREQQEKLRNAEQQREAELKQNQQVPDHVDDNALAKETNDGGIVMVDNEKTAFISELQTTPWPANNVPEATQQPSRRLHEPGTEPTNALDESDDESRQGIKMEDNEEPMSVMAPEPEPDYVSSTAHQPLSYLTPAITLP